MGKAQYLGVNGVARKVKKQYIGVGGVARKIKKGYLGVGGVARQFCSTVTAPLNILTAYTEANWSKSHTGMLNTYSFTPSAIHIAMNQNNTYSGESNLNATSTVFDISDYSSITYSANRGYSFYGSTVDLSLILANGQKISLMGDGTLDVSSYTGNAYFYIGLWTGYDDNQPEGYKWQGAEIVIRTLTLNL